MKTKLLLILLLSAFGSMNMNAQVTFEKTYGGGAPEEGSSVRQTFDGGYIMAGFTQSFGVNSVDDFYLVKTDANGDTLWTKTYGGASYDKAYSVEQTSDSGYIITGMTSSFTAGLEDVYLVKTDKDGVLLWSKTYGGNLGGTGNSVKQTTDGGYIIGGTKVNSGGIHDMVLIKTDAAGDTLWTRTYGGGGDDYGFSVVQSYDGGYMLAGGGSTTGVYLIKTNSVGDTLWTNTSYVTGGPPHLNIPYSIQQTADSGYIVAGITYGATGLDMYVRKTDSSGTLQWANIYAGASNDYALSIQQTTDGGYIMGGWSQSFSGYHSTVLRMDAVGDTLWTRIFNGGGTSYGYSVRQTADGGFIFLGTAAQEMYLVKMDANGNSGCSQGYASATTTPATHTATPFTSISSGGTVTTPATLVHSGSIVNTLCFTVGIHDIADKNTLLVYPNPFTDELFIKGTNQNGMILIFDYTGKEIARQKSLNAETKINTEKLLPGFYLLNYMDGDKTANTKLLKF
ncbi:MAG: T9SS type A sorting domain-containing protein [Bacteroidetes bacterium]|nr:T9SS type A sorting domain-containing protein [Bacteroidota bacterium]